MLELDVPRLGYVIHDLGDEPLPAQLLWEERRLRLKVPWFGDSSAQRMFQDDERWDSGPSGAQPPATLPSELLFVDHHGPVRLVGCHAIGWSANLTYGAGLGTVSISFAITDVTDTDHFVRLNGLRSELEGLGTWLRTASVESEVEEDVEGRVVAATFRLESPPPVRGSRRLNLRFTPSFRWAPGSEPDQTVLEDRAHLQTHVVASRTWDEHLDVHLAIRDLLRLAAWRPLNLRNVRACDEASPERTMDGTSHGSAWRPVTSVRNGLAVGRTVMADRDFMFTHQEISSGGVDRWLRAHRESARAIQPVVRLLELDGASAETHVAQLGIGLEALAYQAALSSGVSHRNAKSETFRDRVERIADLVRPAAEAFIGPTTAGDLTAAYNAVKHANREPPNSDELLRAYRSGLQLFRAWVMHVAGVQSPRSGELMAADRVTRALMTD